MKPHPVAEKGSPGKRAGGIDRHDTDFFTHVPEFRDQSADHGTFARSRRTGHPDSKGLSRFRVEPVEEFHR